MISLAPPKLHWTTLSFASTLYLCPILDLLLEKVPPEWHPELRLGLQEALVNAAKHGNQLDPDKTVIVHFSMNLHQCSWIICDQGQGFSHSEQCCSLDDHLLPPEESECGRGFCLLYHIFDQVHWNDAGNQLSLIKQFAEGKHGQPCIE